MSEELKPRLEIFDVEANNWIIISWHKHEMNAIINADVVAKSRKCRARVINKGSIVYEAGNADDQRPA